MWDYTSKVREYFLNPRNVGEIDNPDGVGEVGNITCGDALKLFLKIDKTTNRIVEAKFKTFGCASAIASSSALTEMVKGKTVEEALKISNKDIADFLGGLPEEKMHCSVMGQEALERAINNFKGIATETVEHEEDHHGRIVCKCFGVTDTKIKRVVMENKLLTVEDVTHYTKAGGACGLCKAEIERIIREVEHTELEKETEAKHLAQGSKPLTNLQKMRMIEDTIERIIKPYLQHDGGSIELIDIDGDMVKVKMIGTCSVCPAAGKTLSNFVEKTLREHVVDTLRVVEGG